MPLFSNLRKQCRWKIVKNRFKALHMCPPLSYKDKKSKYTYKLNISSGLFLYNLLEENTEAALEISKSKLFAWELK